MEKVSFFESIIKILKTISSVPFLIEILILTLLLLIIMIFFYLKKTKKGRNTVIIIYFVCLILLPISQFSFFINSFDKIVENFLKVLYFPSWYLYIFIIIFTDVDVFRVLFVSVKENSKKWINVLTIIYFFIIQFLFFLLIYVVTKSNVNIFDNSELYLNTVSLSIIQISSYIFWIRNFIMLFRFLVNRISNFESKKDKKYNKDVDESFINYDNDNKKFMEKDNDIDNNSDNQFTNNFIDNKIDTKKFISDDSFLSNQDENSFVENNDLKSNEEYNSNNLISNLNLSSNLGINSSSINKDNKMMGSTLRDFGPKEEIEVLNFDISDDSDKNKIEYDDFYD